MYLIARLTHFRIKTTFTKQVDQPNGDWPTDYVVISSSTMFCKFFSCSKTEINDVCIFKNFNQLAIATRTIKQETKRTNKINISPSTKSDIVSLAAGNKYTGLSKRDTLTYYNPEKPATDLKLKYRKMTSSSRVKQTISPSKLSSRFDILTFSLPTHRCRRDNRESFDGQPAEFRFMPNITQLSGTFIGRAATRQ